MVNPIPNAPNDSPPPKLLLVPENAADDDFEPVVASKSNAERARPGRRVRFAGLALILVLGGVAAGYAALRFAPDIKAHFQPTAIAPVSSPIPAPVSRRVLGDSLELAVASFELRMRLFQTHRMECADLARGLVVLEDRWTAYTTARASGAAQSDSLHTPADSLLNARVDAAERGFERTPCPRP